MTTTLVLMGVSGVGKSTVAAELHRSLGWPFVDGDDFHPESNVVKMRKGIALTDSDRWPWLAAIATWIGVQESLGIDCIVTCSALRKVYRDALCQDHTSVWFVHLVATRDVVAERLAQRVGHFMQPSLLASQIDELEPLRSHEPGVIVAATGSAAATATAILAHLRGQGRPR
jgi:gluconokinase